MEIRVRKKKMSNDMSNNSYPLPKFSMLNFRTQGDMNFTESQRLNKATGKQDTFYDFQNEAGYNYKLMTPPCESRYPWLAEGGNYNKSKFAKTPSTSHIVATLLKEGGSERFQSERDDFFARLAELNKSGLDQMYDADIGGAATAARNKAKRYYKSKTPEEQEAKARENFHKSATVPLKTLEGETKVTIRCKAFNRDGNPRSVRYVQTTGGKYVEMDEVPDVYSGAVLGMVFTMRPYCMSKDKYGITYTLVPDVIIYSTGTPGGSSVPQEVIDTPMREYKFETVEGQNGKYYVNTKDTEGRRFMTRFPSNELEWNDLQSGTLGKFSGVTPATAKFTGTLKEDTANPESVAFFDYVEKFVKSGVQHCLDDDRLLTKAKAEIEDNAREMAAETGESFEETFRTMIDDIFNAPVVKRDDNDYRQVKITARQYPYDNEETPNVIPLHDADGANVTETIELRRGAKIAPVVSPSFYFLADGGFGMKFDISLRNGIRVDSNPDASASGDAVLYSMDEEPVSNKRARDDDGEESAKRARVA